MFDSLFGQCLVKRPNALLTEQDDIDVVLQENPNAVLGGGGGGMDNEQHPSAPQDPPNPQSSIKYHHLLVVAATLGLVVFGGAGGMVLLRRRQQPMNAEGNRGIDGDLVLPTSHHHNDDGVCEVVLHLNTYFKDNAVAAAASDYNDDYEDSEPMSSTALSTIASSEALVPVYSTSPQETSRKYYAIVCYYVVISILWYNYYKYWREQVDVDGPESSDRTSSDTASDKSSTAETPAEEDSDYVTCNSSLGDGSKSGLSSDLDDNTAEGKDADNRQEIVTSRVNPTNSGTEEIEVQLVDTDHDVDGEDSESSLSDDINNTAGYSADESSIDDGSEISTPSFTTGIPPNPGAATTASPTVVHPVSTEDGDESTNAFPETSNNEESEDSESSVFPQEYTSSPSNADPSSDEPSAGMIPAGDEETIGDVDDSSKSAASNVEESSTEKLLPLTDTDGKGDGDDSNSSSVSGRFRSPSASSSTSSRNTFPQDNDNEETASEYESDSSEDDSEDDEDFAPPAATAMTQRARSRQGSPRQRNPRQENLVRGKVQVYCPLCVEATKLVCSVFPDNDAVIDSNTNLPQFTTYWMARSPREALRKHCVYEGHKWELLPLCCVFKELDGIGDALDHYNATHNLVGKAKITDKMIRRRIDKSKEASFLRELAKKSALTLTEQAILYRDIVEIAMTGVPFLKGPRMIPVTNLQGDDFRLSYSGQQDEYNRRDGKELKEMVGDDNPWKRTERTD